jgi:hypothetical protein
MVPNHDPDGPAREDDDHKMALPSSHRPIAFASTPISIGLSRHRIVEVQSQTLIIDV